ncbi:MULTISPECIES: ParA family protein [unclassified Coleofasciculus]|uniref:ParA family protein n=1 Tax=Cyanophyceae TaxID=3028117 RepID=UPI001688623D|nr:MULTISPECIES: ParA family protein [unclassified Coleofasciculus]MBD1880203.1 ParA family protein [Coleofasciculus sp. FACHB-T130]MBD1895701.1 ParA family protein [Coleofasciculus sp. FACHB-129]MBD1900485.1 ParA family protein [Coleofasciculus sp. FACHB-125]MBD1943805.1 ParA family protein [Coleofasciculus sp. FACHB-712]MBD2083537.1 ParA family protein [Coleofasciculus sp. FACHB-542]
MGYVIATVNMKGGVGKTTLSVNLATCLAKHHGKRVLVVDLDTQISATLSLMSPQDFGKSRKEKRTLRQLVYKAVKPDLPTNLSIQDIIQPYVCTVKGLDLLPGDIDLYDEFLVSEMLHERALRDGNSNFIQVWNEFEKQLVRGILQPIIKDYDFIILDCAPGYNLLTRSGIVASNFYLLPARPEPLSVVGIQLLERRINKLKESHNLDGLLNLRLMGIVFIMSGNILSGRYYQQVMQRVTEDFTPAQIFKTRIPMDVNVSKAVDSFTPVSLNNPNSSGSKAFLKLTQEFLQKLQVSGGIYQAPEAKVNLANLD